MHSLSQPLRFSISESVSFQKGRDINQMISISLEPEINIQRHDDYVSLKGFLQLDGEYYVKEQELQLEDEETAPGRTASDTRVTEEGTCEMKHQFPIDITVPLHRITNIEDIYVFVEAFDYEIENDRLLKLQADLAIHGIAYEEKIRDARGQEQEKEALDLRSFEIETTIEERKKEQKEEQKVETSETIEPQTIDLNKEKPQQVEVQSEMVIDEKESKEPIEATSETALHHASFETRPVEKVRPIEALCAQEEVKLTEVLVEKTVEPVTERPEQLVNISGQGKREEPSKKADSEAKNEAKEQVEEEREPYDENALYLTKFFARNSEEEFAKMTVCIAQQGDSLEIIAHRYDISKSAIVSVNALGEDAITAGQVLYIPSRK